MNLKTLLTTTTCLLIFQYATGQLCTNDNRFTNLEFFTTSQIDSITNWQYGTAQDWQNNSENLLLDVYYPKLSADTLQKRPFVLLVHGGAFVTGDKSLLSQDCLEFAKRGFVCTTIN